MTTWKRFEVEQQKNLTRALSKEISILSPALLLEKMRDRIRQNHGKEDFHPLVELADIGMECREDGDHKNAIMALSKILPYIATNLSAVHVSGDKETDDPKIIDAKEKLADVIGGFLEKKEEITDAEFSEEEPQK